MDPISARVGRDVGPQGSRLHGCGRQSVSQIWRHRQFRFFSRGRNTPFTAWSLRGQVRLTVCAGRVTHDALATEAHA